MSLPRSRKLVPELIELGLDAVDQRGPRRARRDPGHRGLHDDRDARPDRGARSPRAQLGRPARHLARDLGAAAPPHPGPRAAPRPLRLVADRGRGRDDGDDPAGGRVGIRRLQVAQRRADRRTQGVRRARRAASGAHAQERRRRSGGGRRARRGRQHLDDARPSCRCRPRPPSRSRGRRSIADSRIASSPAISGTCARSSPTTSRRGGDADASGLRPLARELCVTLGRSVRVELPDGAQLVGTATDLDADGRLMVAEANGRERSVAAGDVTHVR